MEEVKAEKRRDELTGQVPAAAEKNTAKKPKKTELPETSAGMVGRVLIDGKDAGYLLTHQPPREMEFSKLSDILMQTKARGGRIILEGVLSLPTPTTLVVFHQGRDGGPEQLLSLDGREL